MSKEPFLPFALPDIGTREIEAVVDALRSGWLSSGPRVIEFERRFARSIGEDVHAVAVNSATAGLHLALEAVGVGPGDEVLVPTWTFTATAEVVRYLGAEPVLVDCEQKTLNIDLNDAEKRLSPRTRAIMPVHFAGLMVDPGQLDSFAEAHGLHVVEDAAHAYPAAKNGIRVGSQKSDATVFSFYATKTMTTGEGGMVVTADAELAKRVRTMRLHGISRNAFDRYRSRTPAWQYDVIAPGYKYNMTDPAAAMGLIQLGRAQEMRDRRAEIAFQYITGLADCALELPTPGGSADLHSWHLFVVRLREEINRDQVVNELAKRGIGTSVHFIPLHMHPYWRESLSLGAESFPVASAEFKRVLSLPLFSRMSDDDVERVIVNVRTTLSSL